MIPLFVKRIIRPELLLIFLFTVIYSSFSNSLLAQTSSREVVNKMLQAITGIKTLKYNSRITERIDGVLEAGENTTKLNISPFKAYIKVKSAELLYVAGTNNNKALIKSNTIPYFNISLDPNSSLLRDGQHHTIFELGFNYFSDIIKAASVKAGNDFDKCFQLKGTINWEGKSCYVIIIEAPDFRYIPYTVRQGENIISIARKLNLSEYMIVEINPDVDDYYHVKPGQEIKIPTVYAKKTVIYIDKESYLPLVQMMFDDKGLFAKYEYRNLEINPKFSSEEFTKEFEDYNFW